MTNPLEPGPAYQGGATAATPPANRTDDYFAGASGTFGISGMDGFALTSQPRRSPERARGLTGFNETSDHE